MRLVAYSLIQAEIHRSGGYLKCEHPGGCCGVSHFVLSWVGRISGQFLERRLCSLHGLAQIKEAKAKRDKDKG